MSDRIKLEVVLPLCNDIPAEFFDDEAAAVTRASALVSPLYGQVTLTRDVGPTVYDFDMRHLKWDGCGVHDKGWRMWRDGAPATVDQVTLFV